MTGYGAFVFWIFLIIVLFTHEGGRQQNLYDKIYDRLSVTTTIKEGN